jgi:hypothetical protein
MIDKELAASNAASAGAKYTVKSNCYRRSLETARESDAAVFLLNADIVLADGFVQKALEVLSTGKRVIEVVGPRGLKDPIVETLNRQYRLENGSICITPTQLSALWMLHIHPLLQMHFVEGPDGAPFHPSHLYWAVNGCGVLARCFHLYPIVVYPKSSTIDFSTTIDDDLVENLRLQASERFIAQDSREMFCCELSPPEQYVGNLARRGDLNGYVDVYASYDGRNLANLENAIIISGVSDLGVQWDLHNEQSASFVRGLLKRYRTVHRRRALKNLVPAPLKSAARRVRTALSLLPAPLKVVLKRGWAFVLRRGNSSNHSK